MSNDTIDPSDLPDDAPIAISDIDDGWYHAQIMDWVLLCPDIDHTAVRLYGVFVSLATRQSQFRRRLTKDQIRYLVPGVNAKPMGRTAFADAMRTLTEHELVVIEDGSARNEQVRDIKTGRFKADESMRFRVNKHPKDPAAFDGWRNAAAKLDAYPGRNWEHQPQEAAEHRGRTFEKADPRLPDPPKEVTHDKFVYIIGEPDQLTVEIGIADDVEARLKQLQTSAARPLSVLWAGRGDQTVEDRLHRRYHKYRLSGEWFRFKQPHQIKQVARMAVELGAIEVDETDSSNHRDRNSGDGGDGPDLGNVDNHRDRNSGHGAPGSSGTVTGIPTTPAGIPAGTPVLPRENEGNDYSPSITAFGYGEISPPPAVGDASASEDLGGDRHAGEPQQPSNEGEGETPSGRNHWTKQRAGRFLKSVASSVPRELADGLSTDDKHRLVGLVIAAWDSGLGNAALRDALTNVHGTKHLGHAWPAKLQRLIDNAPGHGASAALPACETCRAAAGDPPSFRTVLAEPGDPSSREVPCPDCRQTEASSSIADTPSAPPAAS